MVDKDSIELIFSNELQWINDIELRNKVVNVWNEAAIRGNWKSIEEVPFTLAFENSGKLTDHTKRITNIAKAVYDLRTEDLNLDYLIAGALLHDVGKLLEYEEIDGRYVKSEYGKKFRHPISGASLAKELGLPDEVVLIIHAHSYEGDKLKRSPEAVIVNHCDFIDFDIKKNFGVTYES
jgi:putative nucleotidyltransferase with HDIG domain